jgi:hypothetical protein
MIHTLLCDRTEKKLKIQSTAVIVRETMLELIFKSHLIQYVCMP